MKPIMQDPRLENAFKNTQYKEILEAGPSLRFLYGESSGVSEGYTIGEHTVRVINVYDNQKQFYDLSHVVLPAEVKDISKLIRTSLAVHDIGKSIAVRAGNKNWEESFSHPLSGYIMRKLGFTQAEAKITGSLIDTHQTIGNFTRDHITLNEAVNEISRAASYANMKPKDFLKLLEVVYVADAASYDYVRGVAFNRLENGKLVISSDKYEMLVKAVESMNPS